MLWTPLFASKHKYRTYIRLGLMDSLFVVDDTTVYKQLTTKLV